MGLTHCRVLRFGMNHGTGTTRSPHKPPSGLLDFVSNTRRAAGCPEPAFCALLGTLLYSQHISVVKWLALAWLGASHSFKIVAFSRLVHVC